MDGYKNMESLEISIEIEEVLSGRPEEPQLYSGKLQHLHETLQNSEECVRQSETIAKNLLAKKKLASSDFASFTAYVSEIKNNPQIPNFNHLPIVNSGQKASILCYALSKIQLKSQALTHSAFSALAIHKISANHNLEVKRMNCARMISALKSSLGIRMQKTIDLVSFEGKIRDLQENIKKTIQTAQKSEKIEIQDFEKAFLPLVDRATVFSNSKRLAVLKWKNKLFHAKANDLPESEVIKNKYMTALFNNTFKFSHIRVREAFID